MDLSCLGGVLAGRAGADTCLDMGLADPFVQRLLVDAEVLRGLRDGDAVLTGPSHTHDIVAELLGVGSGHGAHPSRPRYGQARSDVTCPHGSPQLDVGPHLPGVAPVIGSHSSHPNSASAPLTDS